LTLFDIAVDPSTLWEVQRGRIDYEQHIVAKLHEVTSASIFWAKKSCHFFMRHRVGTAKVKSCPYQKKHFNISICPAVFGSVLVLAID